MTILADGTDGGGSVRIPASVCGVFGYKPPFGRNPLDLDHPMETLLHYGPITRSVADAAIMQNVMSGPHRDDICSLRERLEIPETLEGIRGWKIAWSMDLGYFEVDQEVQRNTVAAIEVMRSLGCSAEQVDLRWSKSIREAWLTMWQGLFVGTAEHLLAQWRPALNPYVVWLIEKGQALSAAQYYRARSVCQEMYRTLGPILEKFDVLVCPTVAVPAVKTDYDDLNPNLEIDGKPRGRGVGWTMTFPFNLLAQCPAASIPTGFARSGVPTGMQIVARTFDDLRVFRAASAFEAAKPWRHIRPSLGG
jgi:amidase